MLEVSGQPGLWSKFEASQGYRARPCLKKPKLGGWGFSSVVERLPSKPKALGSVSSSEKKKEKEKKPKLVTQFEVSMSACVCGYHMCAWCLNKPEEVSDSAELKLQVVMIHHMGAGN